MDPREMDALVARLVQNPHDQEALGWAHQAGQSDPRSYAMLLEKVGTATQDPAFASHWLTEAANVWSTTLGDAHRAARALMIAIDRDPTQPNPADRLAELYREKGDVKALVALLERRAKALAPHAGQDSDMRAHVAGLHEELGRLWAEAPLAQPARAVENYRRAIEYDPSSQYAIYALRELYKALGQWADAAPLFAAELALVTDPERQLALYTDEAEVRRNAGDLAGATQAARHARSVEGGADPALKQQLATYVLERVQAGEAVHPSDRAEAAGLFAELSETYQGEHGLAYALCGAEVDPSHDRALQLALYFGEQLGRTTELASPAARYLQANPQGALAAEARRFAGSTPPAPPPPAQQSSSARLRAAASVAEEADEVEPEDDSPVAPPVAASPEKIRALLDAAEGLVRKARKTEAAEKYREVLGLEATNEEALTFLEGFLRQTRKYAELRDVLLTATRAHGVEADRRKGWLREIAGLCETQLRDLDTAIQALKQLVALDRSDEAVRGQLRRLLERGGRWDDLATVLEQEAEQETDVEARISLEKALAKIHEQKRKDPVAAGEAWARIANLSPEDESALGTAVKFFEKGERLDLAAQVLADNVGSLSDDSARANSLEKLGGLREAAGDSVAAGEAFAEAAQITQKPAHWEAAERCFVRGEAWDQAATAAGELGKLAGRPRDQAQHHAREAEHLRRAGDAESAVARLEQACGLDPTDDELAKRLEDAYAEADRWEEIAAFVLRRAEALQDRAARVGLRKRAATLQREQLASPDAARESLLLVLNDGDDAETLAALAADAEERAEPGEAAEYLHRLAKITEEPAQRLEIALREARLVSDGLDDSAGAIERYETILRDLDARSVEALTALAALHEKVDDPRGVAHALERHLALLGEPAPEPTDTDAAESRLDLARRLSDLYEGPLDDPRAAIRALGLVRSADPEDYDAVSRLCQLSEKVEDWPEVARYLALGIEVEGDEDEASAMTRRLAEILADKVGKGDEALAALGEGADRGDEACREDYVALGDRLGWKGVVAAKLVEWYADAPAGASRNEKLRGSFDRFLEVGRDADAARVAQELARTRGADAELAQRMEEVALRLTDLETLSMAHDLLVQPLSGPARAEEMVRQAEVLARAGVDRAEAVLHGEQALTSVAPGDAEPLLARLAALGADPAAAVEVYERQITRCKNPADKLHALGRAAQVAVAADLGDRARGFLDLALGGAAQEDALDALEQMAREADEGAETPRMRRLVAEAFAAGGQGARDGGRTRSALLRRASRIAHAELRDDDLAFRWLGDAVIAHVDDASLDSLMELALELGEPARADAVLSRALEEVFDGPLVRKLLARRAAVRRDELGDRVAACADLKRLHDLAPADQAVMDQLLGLLTELDDCRGIVQLYEDQILRGKDPAIRVEIARKVARLWEERLADAREAADAWRRVLRMKAGDPEATEGLDRAKSNMLKKGSRPPPAPPAPAPAPPEAAPPSERPARPPTEPPVASAPSEAPAQPEPAASDSGDDDQPTVPPAAGDADLDGGALEGLRQPPPPADLGYEGEQTVAASVQELQEAADRSMVEGDDAAVSRSDHTQITRPAFAVDSSGDLSGDDEEEIVADDAELIED
ncbi:MAG: hypothetical protein IT376_22985 [Polyangiaceae bacterium]|nr:hypothetical protein [Polyangiaceae bacterium]